jgi:hypothetical protein
MKPTREVAMWALALDKPVEKRAAFLEAMCDGDPALRKRQVSYRAAVAGRVVHCSNARLMSVASPSIIR